MEVNCAGCAGCCLDWRPLAADPSDHERRGSRRPLDDSYNFVALTRDEVRRFVDSGWGDALTPRLWHADSGSERPRERPPADDSVGIDGVDVAAIDGRPVFFVGLRTVPKPVAPFGVDRRWLRSCVFLDPATLQCRIHGDERYPGECADYPGHNIALDHDTECERVEAEHGGDRLSDRRDPPTQHLHLGPEALGAKVFVHPDPGRLTGVIERIADGRLTAEDRADFVACAVGSTPGSTTVDSAVSRRTRLEVLDAHSWVGESAEAWTAHPERVGTDASDAADEATDLEVAHGAPETPGW